MSNNLKLICKKKFQLCEELATIFQSIAKSYKEIIEQSDDGKSLIYEFKTLTLDKQDIFINLNNSLIKLVSRNKKILKRKVRKYHYVILEDNLDVKFLGVVSVLSRSTTTHEPKVINTEENLVANNLIVVTEPEIIAKNKNLKPSLSNLKIILYK